ncbi:MAG: hypothetical protein R6U98_25920 [Pirellulaceae bacterium]
MNAIMCFLNPSRLLRCLWLAVFCAVGAATAREPDASSAPSASPPEPIRYRRVYVPQADLKRFTQGYLPMKRKEFSELVGEVKRQQQSVLDFDTWIQSAEYTAVFSENRLTDGRAKLNVIHSGTEPSVLLLSPCRLALGAASWQGAEVSESAIIGNDLAGNLVARVRDSGLLQFSWTLRGKTNEWNESVFDVVLAPAPRNRLVIALPIGFRLLSDHGLVSREQEALDEASDPPDDMEHWLVQLGGKHRARLTVAPDDDAQQRKRGCNVRQDTRYRLDDDGLEVDCDIELDVQRHRLEELRFGIDPKLQVTSVRLGNRDVAWSLSNAVNGERRQLQVRLDEPLGVGGHVVRLSAVGPLQTGDMWRLPRFHVQGMFWRQGTMVLELPGSLSLRHLETRDAGQSDANEEATASAATARHFDLFSRDGHLRINVVRTPHEAKGLIGTTLDLEPGSITARGIVQLSCDAGRHYVFDAMLPNAWILDGIESTSADILQDHQFVGYEASHKRLRIRLARPLTADHPVRLTIRAHRTSTLVLGVDEFRPFRFSNLKDVTRLVSIAPDPGFRLDLSGDAGVERLDPEALPEPQSELLESRSGAVVFRDDEQADFMTVKVTRDEPTFTAENHIRAEFSDDSLTESYRLICKPESTRVNRLLVLLSEPRSEPVTWSLEAAGNGNQLLSARRFSDDEVQRPQYSGGEIWELVLRHPHDEPFEIHGTRTSDFASPRQISLASFPDATSQEGWLSIVSLDGTRISTEAAAAKPVPTSVLDPKQCSTTRARYRYDVSRNAEVLIKHVEPRVPQAPLWAWHCLVRSQFFSSGEMTHEATYLLESAGAEAFQFRLPPNCTLSNVEIDGAPATRSLHRESSRRYTVALPENARFPRVTLVYSPPPRECPFLRRIAVHVPEVDIPLLDEQWTLWLEPGVRPISHTAGGVSRFDRGASWGERLLGPLAAKPRETPSRLFAARQWASWVRKPDSTPAPNGSCQSFLELLGERYLALAAKDPPVNITWRKLWERYQESAAAASPSPPQVWVATRELLDSSFTLESSINGGKAGRPIPVASEILRDNNMAVVSHRDMIMITSMDGLALVSGAIEPTSISPVVNAVPESYLARKMETLAKWPRDETVPLKAWIAKPPVPEAPWKRGTRVSRRGVVGRYWRAHEVVPDLEGGSSVMIVRTRVLRAVGWACLLITAGLVSWFWARQPRFLLISMAVTAMLALLVPDSWVPIASKLFLGTLLAGLVSLARYLLSGLLMDREWTQQPARTTEGAATVGSCVLALFLALGTRTLFAASPSDASEAARPSKAYNVHIPVDEDGNPVGDYNYLPAEFYDLVHRRGEQSAASPRHWLARRGTYRAVFNWARQRSSLELTSLTVIYQLELFQPQQRVQFPWDGKNSGVQILEARLGGQPIELNWNGDRSSFSITVPGEGLARLELVLWPATADDAGIRNLRFQIPPLARSQLHLETPVDAPPIEVVSAIGETGKVVEPGERLIELGPAGWLELQWPPMADSRSSSRQFDVEQLSWIKVRPENHPDAVILDTKFSIRSTTGQVHRIRVEVDPELRLLPLSDEQEADVVQLSPSRDLPGEQTRRGGSGPVASGMLPDGGVVDSGDTYKDDGTSRAKPTSIMIRPREATQEFTIRLQFRMLNTTGLGNVSLPRVTVADGRIERDWMAVSVAPDLEFTTSVSDSLTSMDPAEFLAGWGEAELDPRACYRIENGNPRGRVSTRAREPDYEVQQQLDVSVGHSRMKLVLQANVDMTQGTLLQHRFSVPQDFQVMDVLVTVAGKPVGADARHDGSGRLTVFLERAVSSPHHIELRGELALPRLETDVPVPHVRFRDVTAKRRVIRLYRKPAVLVSMKSRDSRDSGEPGESGRFREDFGRLLKEFIVEGEDGNKEQGMIIRVSRNQPTVRARMVTTLRRADDHWEAIAEFNGRVTDASEGVVDQFRFEIPKEWTEPFSLEPAMPYEVKPLPGRKRHLILRPLEAVSEQIQVRIRGPLALGDNDRGRAPNIVPLDASRVERFFLLPTELDQQRIDWETSGLRLVSSREVFPRREIDKQGYVAYAVYSRPRAVISDVRRMAGKRQIGLADVHVACRSNGTCFGTVAFQIEPAGQGWVTLESPANCELIQTTVEGVPTILTRLGENRWKLRLASEQLPQQLAVLFRTRLPPGPVATPRRLELPWIADIDVRRTLWTLYAPRTWGPAGDTLPEHRVGPAAQGAIRLRRTASHVESAVETVLDSSATEIKAWYTPWAIRLAYCDAKLTRDYLRGHEHPPAEPQAIETLYRQQAAIGQKLNVSTTVEDFRRKTDQFPQPADMVRFIQPEGTVSHHYAFHGKVPSISVLSRPATPYPGWPRAMGAVAIALLSGLLWLGGRNPRLRARFYQWPYAVGVLIGLAWWLFATPSVLGWLIILVSLWGALRLPMQSWKVRVPAGESPSETPD